MRYIPVLKETTDHYRLIALCNALTAGCFLRALFSSTPESFGRDTSYTTRRRIISFLDLVHRHGHSELSVDSGGYDLTIGKVHPLDFSKLLDCVLRSGRMLGRQASMLFTLDVSHFLSYTQLNAIEDVLFFNQMSIERTLAQIDDNAKLRSKYFLVWHGRNPGQYNLWLRLMEVTGAEEIFLHHSVGGMVKISQVTDSAHSPFIGLAYQCFQSIFNYPSSEVSERGIHLLGVKSRHDRFVGIVLELLFNSYMDKAGRSERISVSCDSASPLIQATTGCRKFTVSLNDQGTLRRVFVGDVPSPVVHQAYPLKEGSDFFYENIERLRNGGKVLTSNYCSPLAVFSVMEENRFMEGVAQSYGAIDTIWRCHDHGEFSNAVKGILGAMNADHPGFFTPAATKRILASFNRIFLLHLAVVETLGAKKMSIDSVVHAFIDELGTPRFYN